MINILPHNFDYVVFFFSLFVLSTQQSQLLYLLLMDSSAFHGIDHGGVDVGVAEDRGEADDVLLDGVKSAREKVAEVMREDLACRNARFDTELFHIRPDI